MITESGYSKDPSIMPEGIAVTMGKEMILEKGGLLAFVRWFESCMLDEDGWWLQRCKNAPKHDIIYVYVIICNRLRYRCTFGGYHKNANGYLHPWDAEVSEIPWPHVVLAGPAVKCPFRRELKGFQGFRYTTKLF